MPAADLELDVVILGGGVAGLWTLRRLLSRGFAAMLVERHALGAGQTIASQGIIHGGLKYTLGGAGGRGVSAAGAIADMPGRWRACLAGGGGGDPDLSGVEVLSSCQHLFTAPGFAARIAGAAASRVIRTEVARVSREHRPAALLGAPSSCDVYRVDEPVLEPRSLVGELAEGAMAAGGRLLAGSVDAIEPLGEDGAVIHIRTTGADVVSVRASCVLLAAGEGNAELLAMLSAASPRPYATMQRRPLHMVMLRSAGLPPLHAHCVGPSSRPLLTVTSQSDHAGRTVWYMGGELAEQGVGRDRVDQIKVARSELARLLPWIDLNEAQFATLRIDRAEGRDEAGKRPDLPVLIPATEGSRVLAAWPTKLAFSPLLADMVERSLQGMGVQPRGVPAELPAFDAPPVAALPWDREDAVWS